MTRFIENTERIRIDRGLSIQALADSIKMDRAQLSKILCGKNSPTLETMERIAKGLHTDVIELLQSAEVLAA